MQGDQEEAEGYEAYIAAWCEDGNDESAVNSTPKTTVHAASAQREAWITHVSRPVKDGLCGPISDFAVSKGGKVDVTEKPNATSDDMECVTFKRHDAKFSFRVKHGAEVYLLDNGRLKSQICVIKSFFRTPPETFPPTNGISNYDHPGYCVSVYPLRTFDETKRTNGRNVKTTWEPKDLNQLTEFDRVLDYTVEIGEIGNHNDVEHFIPIQWLIRNINLFNDQATRENAQNERNCTSDSSASSDIILRHAFTRNKNKHVAERLKTWKNQVAFSKGSNTPDSSSSSSGGGDGLLGVDRDPLDTLSGSYPISPKRASSSSSSSTGVPLGGGVQDVIRCDVANGAPQAAQGVDVAANDELKDLDGGDNMVGGYTSIRILCTITVCHGVCEGVGGRGLM